MLLLKFYDQKLHRNNASYSLHKIGCSFQQHYGYHTKGDADDIAYNSDALDQPYFMASRETGFALNLLIKVFGFRMSYRSDQLQTGSRDL